MYLVLLNHFRAGQYESGAFPIVVDVDRIEMFEQTSGYKDVTTVRFHSGEIKHLNYSFDQFLELLDSIEANRLNESDDEREDGIKPHRKLNTFVTMQHYKEKTSADA